jgi:hypothetical protein
MAIILAVDRFHRLSFGPRCCCPALRSAGSREVRRAGPVGVMRTSRELSAIDAAALLQPAGRLSQIRSLITRLQCLS